MNDTQLANVITTSKISNSSQLKCVPQVYKTKTVRFDEFMAISGSGILVTLVMYTAIC